MSIFGKILAFVNVFAVVGVLALLGMNYAKRLNWQHAVFRQDLMINGLPIKEKGIAATEIGSQTQQDLFRQVSPSTPVATQDDEVERVKRELTNQVQSAGDKKKQIAAYARIMMPMAETIEQRRRMVDYQAHLRDDKAFDALKARLLAAHKAATAPQQGREKPYEERFHDALAVTFSNPPGAFAEAFLAVMKADPKSDSDKAIDRSLDDQLAQLQGQFEQMFRDAVNGGEGVQPGAPSQQRRTIARLLFNMVEILSPPSGGAKPDLSDAGYKRFFIVVGVQAAVEAVNDQAGVLQSLTFEMQAERLRERNLFAVQHRKAVALVLDMKTQVDQHALLLALKKKEREAHVTTLDQRRQDVKKYEEQLAEERRKTAQNLEQLNKLSDQLLGERVKLREKSEDNQKLEKQIRALEPGR
ncbi:MAG TPA: hypothetical protein VMF69_25325 [Gemmataceae bacterium]|nr:hypothetical protein [Gemmataceae bacterium]